MTKDHHKLAVFPGTFDPITLGHVDIIRRGRKLFDELVVAVGRNPEKSSWFSLAERVQMIRDVTAGLEGVFIETYDGLTMEYVRRKGAAVILRGIRDNVDLRDELQAANANLLVGEVETVFLMTSHQHALTSSALIKQIVQIGGYDPARLRRLVPEAVAAMLEDRSSDREGPD